MYIRLVGICLVAGILATLAFNQNYTVPTKYGPLSKIIIIAENKSLYVGGKNILLHFDLDLSLKNQGIIGPVNDSKQCNSFDNSCIYMRYRTVNNHISILKSFRNFLIVCGTARQGICYMYDASDINLKHHFGESKKNYLGSENSSVMLITKDESGVDMFFIGQSYDSRKADFFYNEFATLDISKSNKNWNFDHYSAWSFLSVCDTKRENFKLKFLHIFDTKEYIFHVFIRSINNSGSISYETRISKLCKYNLDYGSYEEMPISCKTPTKYDIGIAAHYDIEQQKLYMTFGIRAYNVDNIQADNTQGSVVCVYTIDEMIRKFASEVLTKCFKGLPTWGTPSWHCNSTQCTQASKDEYSEGDIIKSCEQKKMEFGIEAHGDGFSKTAVYQISNELLTSVLPLSNSSEHIILAGSNTGFLRKILVTSTQSTSYVKFDVSGDRNIPVGNEMVLDTHSYLYLLTGNRVTKLSMTSCQLHKTCGECVPSDDPLGCGWCFDHCTTETKCQHSNMWHNQSCPPFVQGISPANGPLEGSTKLTITGENFGSMVNNANVSIGAASCLIQNISDTRITCLTSRVGLPVPAAVKVSVTDSTSKQYRIDGISERLDITFEYTQSSIMNIFPMKGPISGKTMLTITGEKFEIGSILSVKIGKMQCDIQTKNNTEIVCLTQSCGTCEQVFEGENLEMSNCRYSGDIVVAIDGASYQPLENKTFCYMPNPEIIQQPSRNSTMISGGLNIEIHGNWFDSVTNYGMLISVGDAHIGSSCRMKHSGSMLVCSTPDLTSELNKSAEVIVGRMTVMLDNNPVKSTTLMIYPDPELDYLDIGTQLKEIEMKEKLLELKGRYLNSAAKKEDYIIKINGTLCPVMDLHQTYLKCNLSNTVHIKELPLLVEVSVGLNWKTVLGYMKFFHVEYRKNQIHVQLAAICLGTFAVLILCLVFVMRKKHLGVFRKKATEEFSVVYFNSPETRGLMDPPNDTGNSSAEQGMPRYVKQKKQSVSELVVEGATWNPGFDAIGIVDMLKQQNIFIERDLVRLGQDIGHGNFGCVYQGYLRLMEEKDEQLVAVKTILKTEVQDINAIINEAMIMKDFNHPNVMSLIGISIAPGEFPLVIIPFMSNGDLLSYIRSADNKPTIKDLVKFGLDVARGMEYLGSIKYVHRDLAARNCMMDENLKVKVADFGLARDIYTKNYYSSDNKKMLPVKWMAPESLENGTYSTKSDVWSFGVVMWELMTRGSAPYCDVNNWDMHKYLHSGRRLKRTEFCPTTLYDIMMACWKFDPYDRPTFREVNKRVTVLVEQEK
ncbi:hepatocyte growth factor receptor-like isoform X4 [Mytilus californianus]|uniref:hepatocyte growth factor receptor-like isoform X4 n=1 Tax=Mytilus californianus TaxID=6549 RepID=UPI0022485900|nr:hepatocyte growth factor receptor-like isoform X4 [Mytilus californianus]